MTSISNDISAAAHLHVYKVVVNIPYMHTHLHMLHPSVISLIVPGTSGHIESLPPSAHDTHS